MTHILNPAYALLALSLLICGCASRPVNPPLEHADPNTGYRLPRGRSIWLRMKL